MSSPTTSSTPTALLHGGDIVHGKAPLGARRLVHDSDVCPLQGRSKESHDLRNTTSITPDVCPLQGRSKASHDLRNTTFITPKGISLGLKDG
jgi:hypothetical protein